MQRRRIWELELVNCKIIGLTFDEPGLDRVFNRLGLNSDYKALSPAKRHAWLVHLCATESPVSRYVEKTL